MNTKVCKKCGRELTTDKFTKRKDSIDGLRHQCKDCEKQRHKEYRENNKDKVQQYNTEHREQKKEYSRKYRKEHPEIDFNCRTRRRQKEETQGQGITKDQWIECMEFFEWKCAYSGEKLTKQNRTLDHITSLNKNGENEIWNLVPMKVNYNSSKQDKEMLSWYKGQEYYNEERLDKIIEWYVYAFNKYYKGAN